VTAPLPSPYRSPIAGLFNTLVALAIRLLDLRALELEADIAIATDLNQRLKTNTPGGTE
jgi:hypothetical protein